MSVKIQLTPAELRTQSAELSALKTEYEALFQQILSEMKHVNSNWSAKLAHNFSGKVGSAVRSFSTITQELEAGAKIAAYSAAGFETVDKQLAKLYNGDYTVRVMAAPVNTENAISTDTNAQNGNSIDEAIANLPMWEREIIKDALKKYEKSLIGDNPTAILDAVELARKGDYEGATKKILGMFADSESWGGKLQDQYIINSITAGIFGFADYCKNPTFENLCKIGWGCYGPGAVLETAGNAAWDIVKKIPGISAGYDKYGVTDTKGAFNTMYTEWTRVFLGDKMADSVKNYYADNGGYFEGLYNGGKRIVNEVHEASKRNGGIIGLWQRGWNSIFH